MDCYIDKDDYFIVHCHKCNRELELGNLVKIGDNIICLFCNAHLGFIWDIPEKYRKIRGWEGGEEK